MFRYLLEQRIHLALQRATNHRWFVPLVSTMAVGSSLSMAVPFTSILVPAVLLQPARWRWLWWWGSVGSALGSSLLVIVFHHLGWAQLYQRFPDFAASQSWQEVLHWMKLYGLPALTAVAALPLPQTPALLFCSISNQPLPLIFLAVLIGKLCKYGVIAACAALFPAQLGKWLHLAPARIKVE